ncbi:sporulation protein Cse60 [Mycoplasmatota bacterium zrk1]
MKVKIFDFEHDEDLEEAINEFIDGKNVVDIKYQIAMMYDGREQVFSYSAMILYD